MLGRVVFVLCALTSTAFASERPSASDDATGAAVAFALMALCVAAYTIARAGAVRRTFATSRHLVDVNIDAMKRIARAQRSRAALLAVACALLINAITWLPLSIEAKLGLAATPAILLVVAVFASCQLQLLMWLRAERGLRVSSHGDYLFVSRGTRLVGWVTAPPTLLARAIELPVATLRS